MASVASPPKARIIENFVVVWLDPQVDEFKDDYEYSITHLRSIVNSIETFNDKEKCIQFLHSIKDERIFVIVSGGFGQEIIEELQKMRKIVAVYIFCYEKKKHSQWAKKWTKIKEVLIEIKPLCEILKKDVRQSNNDLVSFSVIEPIKTAITSTENSSNDLDQSFMYSQLLKEILLEMTYDDNVKDELIKFCRFQYAKNKLELEVIEEFEKYYPRKTKSNKSSPIWWYTRDSFTYSMLNRALRTQDIEIILKMGFFIRDVHEHIKQLHLKFVKTDSFMVYRGQGMLPEDFERLKKSEGGLLSFNNFLSTTTDKNISLLFVQRAQENVDHIIIHFHMKINSKYSSTPFASLDNESYYNDYEKEILFSMHTVFRVDNIKQITERLYEVYLTLTNDHDQQLTKLTEYIRYEIQGQTGWHRLASLLTKMGEFDKSLHVYQTLLTKKDNNWEELSYLYNQLGYNYKQKGDLSQALIQYEKSFEIDSKHYSANDSSLTPIYSNIGEIYRLQHDLKRALDYFQRALHIEQQSIKCDQLKIASYYNNIGMIYGEKGEYAKALENYENTLKIKLNQLPAYHPSLATIYNNIGSIHYTIRDYSNALLHFQKALQVEQKVLPPTHHSLAVTHNHIAFTLTRLDRYQDAIQHAKQAVEIASHTYQPDHEQFQIYQLCLDKLNEYI